MAQNLPDHLAPIAQALENGNPADVRELHCEDDPMVELPDHFHNVGSDRHGRLWAWNPITQKMRMIYDPRDAGP